MAGEELGVPTIFGPDWESLGLSDVQAFLDGADPEPLVWEAKGTDIDRHTIRRNVCGFGNSHEMSAVAELKHAHRATWAAGDYAAVAELIDKAPPRDLLARAELRPGLDVLDVATGTGTVAIHQSGTP